MNHMVEDHAEGSLGCRAPNESDHNKLRRTFDGSLKYQSDSHRRTTYQQHIRHVAVHVGLYVEESFET